MQDTGLDRWKNGFAIDVQKFSTAKNSPKPHQNGRAFSSFSGQILYVRYWHRKALRLVHYPLLVDIGATGLVCVVLFDSIDTVVPL
jgi:hypothetical protein